MNKLQKIQYNCRKATFLIEKQLIGHITVREKMELQIHLVTCAICKTFQQQSLVINSMVKNLFNVSPGVGFRLDEKFKKDLQKRINEKIDND